MLVSMSFAYQQFQRPKPFSTLLRVQRSFRQLVVDQYAKLESKRSKYLRRNQTAFCASNHTLLRKQLGDSQRTENEVVKFMLVALVTCSYF